GEEDELGDYRRHREQRNHRSKDTGTPPCARAGGWKSPECEAEHPDTDDRYTRELPNPVVRSGGEKGDAACGGAGDLYALQQQSRANRARDRDQDGRDNEQQADDPELTERLEVERMRVLAEDLQRAVLQPPRFPGSRATTVQRMSAEFRDRGAPELPPPAA